MYFQRIRSNTASSIEAMNGLPTYENLDENISSELFLLDFFTSVAEAPYSVVVNPWLESFRLTDGDDPSIEEAFRGSLVEGPHQLQRLVDGEWVVLYREDNAELLLLKDDALLVIDKANSTLSCFQHTFTPQELFNRLARQNLSEITLSITEGCQDLNRRIGVIGPPTQPNSWTSCIALASFVMRLLDVYPLQNWPQNVDETPILERYATQFFSTGIKALKETKGQDLDRWDQWLAELRDGIENATNCLDEETEADLLAMLNELDT